MKGDVILKVIAGLLIPFLMLAGFLIVSDCKVFGLFAVVSAIICFLSAYYLYYIKFGKVRLHKLKIFQFVVLGIAGMFIAFLVFIMLRLVNLF